MTNLSDFEVNEAIAKLRGATETLRNTENGRLTAVFGSVSCFGYSPITDNDLNLELRDEFKVEISYFHRRAVIYNWDTGQQWTVCYFDGESPNRAALECILESVK